MAENNTSFIMYTTENGITRIQAAFDEEKHFLENIDTLEHIGDKK